jgi:hypothetical protein
VLLLETPHYKQFVQHCLTHGGAFNEWLVSKQVVLSIICFVLTQQGVSALALCVRQLRDRIACGLPACTLFA